MIHTAYEYDSASAAGQDLLLAAALVANDLPPHQRAGYLRAQFKTEFTWQLIERYAPQVLSDAIAGLLRDAAEMVAPIQVGDAGRGQATVEPHRQRAPSGAKSPNPRGAQPSGRSGAGQHCTDARPVTARSAPLTNAAASRAGPTQEEKAARRAAYVEAIKRVAVRHSRLDELRCNGVPLGDLTAGEARVWARETGRNVRFVEIVTQGLQPDMRIRDMVKPDEADDAWARSGEIQ